MGKDLEKIRAKLGHLTLEWEPVEFMDTGFPDLNEVLGHPTKGLEFGRLMEIAGWESQGKTALALSLTALAQQQGAAIVWADFENSFDAEWAKTRQMKVEIDSEGKVIGPDEFELIQPYVGNFEKEKLPRLSTAQELCAEVEAVLALKHKKFKKITLVVDSIPAMLSEGEAEAGLEGQNLRTNMDLPLFLGKLLRRWIGLAQSYNVMMIFINQLRNKPDPYNPVYTPGGNATRFYCHARVRIRRAKGGFIKKKGKNVGIQGIIENYKNKSGSPERAKVGFKLYFKGPMEFLAADKLEKEDI